MSMIYPLKTEEFRDAEIKNAEGATEIVNAKFIKFTYKCRPQVIDRKKNWVKFGKLAKDTPLGMNKEGVAKIQGPVYFIDDEGEVSQEIEIAKQLIELGKRDAVKRRIK